VIERKWLSDGRHYLDGGDVHPSVADILLVSELESLAFLKTNLASTPLVQAHSSRVKKLPSFVEVHRAHAEFIKSLVSSS